MSETKVAAKGVGVYISTNLTSPAYKLAICLTTNGFDRKRDTIDTSSKCDDGTANFESGRLNWSVKGEGFAMDSPSAGNLSFGDLDAIMLSGATVLVKVADDPTTPVKVGYSGLAILTSLTEQYPDNEYVKFNFEFQGKGLYTNLI
jgi:hypothetical protein